MFTEENEDADVYIEGDDKISKEIKTLEEKHKYKINRRLLKRLLMISRKLEVGPIGVTNDLSQLEEGLKKEKDSKSIFRGEFNKTRKILSKHLADTERKAGFHILPGGRVKIMRLPSTQKHLKSNRSRSPCTLRTWYLLDTASSPIESSGTFFTAPSRICLLVVSSESTPESFSTLSFGMYFLTEQRQPVTTEQQVVTTSAAPNYLMTGSGDQTAKQSSHYFQKYLRIDSTRGRIIQPKII